MRESCETDPRVRKRLETSKRPDDDQEAPSKYEVERQRIWLTFQTKKAPLKRRDASRKIRSVKRDVTES